MVNPLPQNNLPIVHPSYRSVPMREKVREAEYEILPKASCSKPSFSFEFYEQTSDQPAPDRLWDIFSRASFPMLLSFLFTVQIFTLIALRNEANSSLEFSSLEKNLSGVTSVVSFLLSEHESETLVEAPLSSRIAEITSEKAQLKNEPNEHASVLMAIARGSRLIIEREKNGYFEVTAPTGERAWVNSDLVREIRAS